MRSYFLPSLSVVALAFPALANASPDVQHRPDLNAFVNHRVNDTRSLIAEVQNNPEVSDRYERHFAMTRQQVLAYLGTLHREPLANEGEFTVYSVPPNGVVKMHREVYRKGTPFFVDSTGRPTLIVKCGNPVVPGRPVTQKTKLNPLPPTSTDTVAFVPDLRDTPIDMTDLSDALMPLIPDAPPEVLIGALEPTAETLVPLVGGIHSALPYLGLAPLLAPIFHSSGSGGGGIVIFPTPEPAPFAALGLGALALVRRRRRRA